MRVFSFFYIIGYHNITNIITFLVRNKIGMVLKCVHSISRAHKQLKNRFLLASLHQLGDKMSCKKSAVAMTKSLSNMKFSTATFCSEIRVNS